MPRSPSKRIKTLQEKESLVEAPSEQNVAKCDQSVMFMKDSLYSSTDVQIIRLKHPRTSSSAMYVIDKDKNKMFEMISFDEGNRSWFIGETVQSNGKLYLVSPVDVTYLILPYLMQADKNVPLDHLLIDPDYPEISHLASAAASKDFSHVADRKGNPELGVWRYNEETTLNWLESKVKKLSTLLQEKKIPTSAAQSFTYVRTMELDQTQEAYRVLAHGIISDYLLDDFAKKLYKHLKLPEITNKQKALKGAENQPPSKKQKMEGPIEDYSKDKIEGDKAKTPQTAKAKALAKSAAGSKSIMSFFGKK